MTHQPFSKYATHIHHDRQHQPSHGHALFGLQQTSSFLKREIGEIIKNELKAYHLRIQLQAQLQQYKKNQQNQKMMKEAINNRIHVFREKEKKYRKKELQLFESRQKKRQQKLKLFAADKQNAHQNKCSKINAALKKVRNRYFNITIQDQDRRLSKLAHTSQGKRMHKSSQSQHRITSLSQRSSRVAVVKMIEAEEQKHKITNYLNKVQRSQSKILLKEIEKDRRRQVSLRKKVKCLVGQRKKLQQDRMQKCQKEYIKRMDTFASHYSQIKQNKELALMSRTMANARIQRQASARRQHIHREQIDKIVSIYTNGSSNSLLQQYRSNLDLKYTNSNRSLNLRKKKLQQNQVQLNNTIKMLTQKIDLIKNLREGQKLDPSTIKVLLEQAMNQLRFIDKSDPQYANIADFLVSERGVYMEGVIRRQQQQRCKLKKMSKGIKSTA